MGCEVVSVYADQVVGVIGYPQQVLDDLMKRDYSPAYSLKPESMGKYNVYGFSQSYAEGAIFTCVVKKRQYFVYVAGRFLMRVDIKSKQQKSLMHHDRIVCLDVKGKLCITGSVGGKIIVWDLQFLQKKIQARMPLQSNNFSSIGITNKYIFCSDTNQPKNNIYCYDLRTAKLKAKAFLGSFEPTLRGKVWGQNHLVTAAADGLWFSRYSLSENVIDVTKGMFRIYPKTSMTCLDIVNDTYIVSGGVDGYVFLWAHYQCQKVLRASESTISQIHLSENNFIVSSFNNNVKCFSFEIKMKTDMDEQELKNGQITADFVSIVIDSYEKSAPLQSICSSLLDPSIYYAQTKNGVLFDKMIPSAQYISRISSYKNFDQSYINFNKASSKYVYDQAVWVLSHNENKQLFHIQQVLYQDKNWFRKNEFIASSNGYKANAKKLNIFIHKLMHVFYATQTELKYSKVIRSDANDDLKEKIEPPHTILKIQNKEEIIQHEDGEQIRELDRIKIDGIVDVEAEGKIYIVVFFNKEYSVFLFDQNESETGKYTQIKNEEYEGQRLKQLELEGEKIQFEEVDGVIEIKGDENDQQLSKVNKIHCVRDAIIWESKQGQYISIGGQTLIVHSKNSK